MTQKYIVGLGCSWTQGEGGYPQEVVDAHNGRTQIRCGQDQDNQIMTITYVYMN